MNPLGKSKIRIHNILQSLPFLEKRSRYTHSIFPFTRLDDRVWLEYFFKKRMGYSLDFKHLQTFNEKLQWMKIYDRNPLYTQLSDKYLVRDYVIKKIGKEFLNPLVGVYQTAEQIDWTNLPARYVVKPNHGAGWVIIRDGKDRSINNSDTVNILDEWLQTNFYERFREWQYKDIKPRILIEDYIEGEKEYGLLDYKFFCFQGIPTIVQVNIDRFDEFSLLFMDMDWKETPMSLQHYPKSHKIIPKPSMFEEMCQIASKLADNFRFCRVDLYNIGRRVVFGELTFTPNAGFEKITPIAYDQLLGDLLQID